MYKEKDENFSITFFLFSKRSSIIIEEKVKKSHFWLRKVLTLEAKIFAIITSRNAHQAVQKKLTEVLYERHKNRSTEVLGQLR